MQDSVIAKILPGQVLWSGTKSSVDFSSAPLFGAHDNSVNLVGGDDGCCYSSVPFLL